MTVGATDEPVETPSLAAEEAARDVTCTAEETLVTATVDAEVVLTVFADAVEETGVSDCVVCSLDAVT